MSAVQRAKILRGFPGRCRFTFDRKGEHLLVQDRKSLHLIDLKQNTLTEFFSTDRGSINAFGFSPDENHAYVCIPRCSNSSTVYIIDLKTREVSGKLIVPLETCEWLFFGENNLVFSGKRYDTHIESCDGHELIDEYLCRFTVNPHTNEHSLEEDLDEQDYRASMKEAGWPGKNTRLPEGFGIYTYQNTETEFWDDTVYYELYYKSEILQQIERDETIRYVGKQEGFESFSMIKHEAFYLLVGYHSNAQPVMAK